MDPAIDVSDDATVGRRFRILLAAVCLAALGIRLAYVLVVTRHENGHTYDALYYSLQSYLISLGHFFEAPPFAVGPDAAHPPLTALVLTPVSYLFGVPADALPQRLTMAALGTVVVFLVGLLGRRIAGARVGIVAAGLAAVYPNFWIPNGIVMSETLSMLVMAVILLAVYRLLCAPTWANAALAGVACGVEILVRAELVLLVPFLLVPAALACRPVRLPVRLALAALAVAAALLTVGPWLGRNLATFHDATYISTGDGPVLLGANCPTTYFGPGIGLWSLPCSRHGIVPGSDQSVTSSRQLHAAEHYITKHESRLPLVAAVRVARLWDLYAPVQMARLDVNEGRPVAASIAGLVIYYALLPVALVGVVVLRRRQRWQWPLLVPAGVLTLVAAVDYGIVRFRAPFELSLVVLAAVAVDAGWRRLVR
ncbi:MAG TPA: glycosyltransferase family 39 protein [Acidimicrobiales bacterium]|nr:glycosyltransferase family 39 protein [Acidimicrobiales bacterium]